MNTQSTTDGQADGRWWTRRTGRFTHLRAVNNTAETATPPTISPLRVLAGVLAADLTPTDVEETLGWENGTIDAWRAGTRQAMWADMEALGGLTGLPADFFYTDEPSTHHTPAKSTVSVQTSPGRRRRSTVAPLQDRLF